MSPLRGWTVGENVGAPLVTPGAGTAQRNPTKRIRRGKRGGATCDARCRHGTTEFRHKRNSAANGERAGFACKWRTAASVRPGKPRLSSGRHECRPYGGKRGGATCDARCRHGTTKFRRKRNPSANGILFANGEPRHPSANGEPRHPSAPANPTRHPGDMNVAPTWADRGEKRLQRE